MNRLFLLLFLMMLAVFSFSEGAAAAGKGTDMVDPPIRFAVIGDRTGSHTPGIFKEIVVEIERLKPDFTMTVGDMIEGYTDDAEQIRRRQKRLGKQPAGCPPTELTGEHTGSW